MINSQDFINGYIEALLWSSVVDVEEGLHGDDFEPSEELLTNARAECLDFIGLAGELLDKVCGQVGYSDEMAGHDFALTRNGHGAGFWDRDLGDDGEKLSEMSRTFGSADLYLGDDELIYSV